MKKFRGKLLIALAAFAIFLAGCGTAPTESGDASSAGTGSTSSAIPSLSAPISSDSLQPEEWAAPPGVLENYERTSTLPEGPYTTMTAEDYEAAATSWFHFLDPALMKDSSGIVPQPVLMLGLDGPAGEIVLTHGVFETGARMAGFMGHFNYLQDGIIEATFGKMVQASNSEGPYTEMGEPTFTVQVKIERIADDNMIVATFMGAGDVENSLFQEWISPYITEPLAFWLPG